MLRVFTPAEALNSILVRQPLDSMPVPPAWLENLELLFGAPVTPEQAVTRILADVRQRTAFGLLEFLGRKV